MFEHAGLPNGVMQLVGVEEVVFIGRAEAKLMVTRATAEVEKRMMRAEMKLVLGRLWK